MLGSAQIRQFSTDGFLRVPSALEPAAIEEVRQILDPLFERFDSLPSRITRDLGARTSSREAMVRSAEINRPSALQPRLLGTRVYRRCRDLARTLAMRRIGYSYDHAIYKAPRNERETPWHQDHAYTGHRLLLPHFHFWVPLQEATVENGCMQFVPGSHRQGLREHVRHANGHVLEASPPSESRIVACPVPLGGLTIHSPLVLHYTGPNNSDEVRRAWILHLGPWGRRAKLHPAILLDKVIARLTGRSR